MPVTPHDGQAESPEIVKRKEFRLVLEAFVYKNFFTARLKNKQEDIGAYFRDPPTPEDEEYAALVQSWVKAKVYPGLKLPFIIPQDQVDQFFKAQRLASQLGVVEENDSFVWRNYKLKHVVRKLELEMVLFDLSNDPVWKELQLDYIHRLDRFLRHQMQEYGL